MFIERNGIKIELSPEEIRLAHEEYEKDNFTIDNESVSEKEVVKATTISFTTTEGPDATQFDTQDQAEVLELLGQLLQENNLELVSIDSIEPCEIVEKVENVASVDEILNKAKRTCESLSNSESTKSEIDFVKE